MLGHEKALPAELAREVRRDVAEVRRVIAMNEQHAHTPIIDVGAGGIGCVACSAALRLRR